MTQSYHANRTISIDADDLGCIELKMVVDFIVHPGCKATSVDPGEEPSIEVNSVEFFRATRNGPEKVSMPPWLVNDFCIDGGFDDWLMSEASEQAEIARDEAADAAYERSQEERA
jgi:hypothetical protein